MYFCLKTKEKPTDTLLARITSFLLHVLYIHITDLQMHKRDLYICKRANTFVTKKMGKTDRHFTCENDIFSFARLRSYIHTYIHTCTQTNKHIRIFTRTYTRTNTRTHAQTHIHTHAYIYTYTHM